MRYEIEVRGTPAPQGSKRVFKNGGMTEMSKAVGPWREAVRSETQRAMAEAIPGPVSVSLIFTLARPRAHYRTGANSHLVKDSAPGHPATKPDIDKLARAVLDGLTMGGAWHDDSQVIALAATKAYGPPGCRIIIYDLKD